MLVGWLIEEVTTKQGEIVKDLASVLVVGTSESQGKAEGLA